MYTPLPFASSSRRLAPGYVHSDMAKRSGGSGIGFRPSEGDYSDLTWEDVFQQAGVDVNSDEARK
jgi:hypothetical protein